MFETIYSSPTNYALRRLPSVREQVELCRHIASQLVANDNINSKGANMFFKRVKKAHTWEVPPLDSKEQEIIENTDEEKMREKLAETLLRNKEHRLSLVLDPRGKIHSLSSLKAEGQKVNEHNAVTPDLMSRLMKDLESPEANPKAAELFAKRKAMSHEWETVTEPWKQPPVQQHQQQQQPAEQQARMQENQRTEANPLPDPSHINNNSNQLNGNSVPITPWNPPDVQRRPSSGPRPDDGNNRNKRYSLLDPDVFVPTAGSRLSSTVSRTASDRVRVPSPWRSGGGSNPVINNYNRVTHVPMTSPDPGPGLVLERKQEEVKTLTPSSNPCLMSCSPPASSYPMTTMNVPSCTSSPRPFRPSPHVFPAAQSVPSYPSYPRFEDCHSLPPASHVASLPMSMSSLCVSPASQDGSIMSNAGSNDSNNFSNYTNYFYQTLKHSNPYQNLPESILL